MTLLSRLGIHVWLRIPLAVCLVTLGGCSHGEHAADAALAEKKDDSNTAILKRRLSLAKGSWAVPAPDTTRFAVIGEEGGVTLWSLTDEKPLFGLCDSFKDAMVFSPNGKSLALGEWDRLATAEISLWDLDARRRVKTLRGLKSTISEMAFSPDGKQLAVVYHNKVIQMWDIAGEKEMFKIERDEEPVDDLSFSPDSSACISYGYKPWIVLWDSRTGAECHRFKTETNKMDGVYEAGFSSDSSILASLDGSPGQRAEPKGSTVRIWWLHTRKEVCRFDEEERHLSLAFSGSGIMASGTREGNIHLWDLSAGKKILSFTAHDGKPVGSVVFTPDGRSLISTGGDSTIATWDFGKAAAGRAVQITGEELKAACSTLENDEPLKAFEAAWTLVAAANAKTIGVLQNYLQPNKSRAEEIGRLVAGLDQDDFAGRGKASEALEKMGVFADSALHRALQGARSEEVRRRAKALLDALETPVIKPKDALGRLRAVRVLELIGSSEARAVLEALVDQACYGREVEAAKAALQRLSRRDQQELRP